MESHEASGKSGYRDHASLPPHLYVASRRDQGGRSDPLLPAGHYNNDNQKQAFLRRAQLTFKGEVHSEKAGTGSLQTLEGFKGKGLPHWWSQFGQQLYLSGRGEEMKDHRQAKPGHTDHSRVSSQQGDGCIEHERMRVLCIERGQECVCIQVPQNPEPTKELKGAFIS